MAVTVNDVAKRAGVSMKTVSRVINREDSVAKETRRKVLAAIEDLEYVPNLWAQRLRSGQSGVIALLFYDATPSYIMDVINGLMDCGDQYHYTINLHRVNVKDPKQVDHILSVAGQKQIEGFVITPPCDNSEQLIDGLHRMKFPFVQLSPRKRTNEYAWVSATDEEGSCEAARYLLALGHNRIGIIQGDVDHQASWDRLNGYKFALQEAGVNIDEGLIKQGGWTFRSGLREARSLMSIPQPPSAIMAADDQVAAGIIQAAWELGVNCPEQISVIGFDDVPLARQITPPLTTIKQPISEIAHKAMTVLIEQLIPGTNQETSFQIPTELIIRNSTEKHDPS